jgi:hypothetical protein
MSMPGSCPTVNKIVRCFVGHRYLSVRVGLYPRKVLIENIPRFVGQDIPVAELPRQRLDLLAQRQTQRAIPFRTQGGIGSAGKRAWLSGKVTRGMFSMSKWEGYNPTRTDIPA